MAILAKCVMGWKVECGLEGVGRVFAGCLALRTSAKRATEGRLGGSAWEDAGGKVPCRGLEGRCGAGRCYALRRRMHRTVILAKCVEEWKVGCGLEVAGRVFVGCPVLRTST